MIEQAVILAGGLATRLYPVTKTIPKSLIDINGSPFIDHQIKLLEKNRIKKILICAGYLGEMIQDHLKKNKPDIEISFSFDGEKLLGTGGAIRKAIRILDNEFFVIYGDSYLPVSFQDVAQFFEISGKKSLMTVVKNEDMWDKSNVIFEKSRIIRYDKKDKSPEMKYIDYGLGIFKKKVFDEIPEDQVTDLADIYKDMLKKNELAGYKIKSRFYEIGSFHGIEELKEYLKNSGA